MSLHGELREVIFDEDQEMRMIWLQQRGLIASQKTCRKCDSDMRFGGKSGVTDGFVWRCKRKGCKTTVSARDGSFFGKSKLPMSKLLHCIYLWALETSIVSATAQLAVSAKTLVDFYNFLREVCSTALIRNPVQLGGPGHTLPFVDPVTGVHTQNIESYWNRCKTKIKSMKGVRRHMLPGYLDEFMWRERVGSDKFDAILNEIALQYPVNG